MKLKCIVLEKSIIHQKAIEKMVNYHPNLEMSGIYNSSLEANQHLKNYNIDLMFLDVDMPLLSGFDFLGSLKNPPKTILTSNNADYAVKAFEYNISYYLLKPITTISFNIAVSKVLKHHNLIYPKNGNGEFVLLKSNFKKVKVVLRDIKWVKAIGDYVKIVTDKQNFVVQFTMKRFEKMLPDDKFLRIHKSYIVNLRSIDQFTSRNVEINGNSLPMSRSKKQLLENKLMFN
ncbi:LytTR family two component transcriptional regulator [Maribacter caenipelagi]|uniref:LytTR family two component transcriptional regulator n=1 Tax=Maribacter caenipelagi TaxID=1447781 RepID=A0A4R7D860_9FLAO|nr:LytTR family DNA-binding domain-containing protein [Maribacter caenipelagi]TDS16877.1 LytTR family two component transcriptional regulator [Maribacter caenipelagi]